MSSIRNIMADSRPVSASSISFNLNDDSRGENEEDYNSCGNGFFRTFISSIMLFYIIGFLIMTIVLIMFSLFWLVKYNNVPYVCVCKYVVRGCSKKYSPGFLKKLSI